MYLSEDIFHFCCPNGLVLDLGCGVGRNSIFMSEKGLQVVGLDVSWNRLKRIDGISGPERIWLKGIDATSEFERICADAQYLPFKSNIFDSVICSEVLEHLVDPAKCVEDVHRILKPGGSACFTIPCLNIPIKTLVPIYRKIARVPEAVGTMRHLHVFSAKGLAIMLKPFFEIMDVEYRNFVVPFKSMLPAHYELDKKLASIERGLPLLHYFAASVRFKVIKKEDGKC